MKARGVRSHAEHHRIDRIGWLRAAVLGANDGIVSTASLVLGVAAAGAEHRTILLTSVSGLIAGAMSMAAGEFVSVHSQEDTESADLAQERAELKQDPAGEQRELAGIYVSRGLDQPLADQVAGKLWPMTRWVRMPVTSWDSPTRSLRARPRRPWPLRPASRSARCCRLPSSSRHRLRT